MYPRFRPLLTGFWRTGFWCGSNLEVVPEMLRLSEFFLGTSLRRIGRERSMPSTQDWLTCGAFSGLALSAHASSFSL